MLGVWCHPILLLRPLISAARVPDSSIHSSGWQVPERYCSRFGIEGELVVRLGQDIGEHANAATVYEAAEAWRVGIELCGTRFLNGERANPCSAWLTSSSIEH